jgi:hypothetical protein
LRGHQSSRGCHVFVFVFCQSNGREHRYWLRFLKFLAPAAMSKQEDSMSKKKILLVGAVVGALSLVASFVLTARSTDKVEPIPLQSFEPTNVKAPAGQGLNLSGVVKDNTGKVVRNAEVFLSASGEKSLTSLTCRVCGEPLVMCKAAETAKTIDEYLSQHRGELNAALSTHSNDKGEFKFEGLLGTSFTVWGHAPGLAEGVRDRAAPGDPVELFLPLPRSIDGQLVNESGQGIEGEVFAMSHRLAKAFSARTEANGKFHLTNLGEGPFTILGKSTGLLPRLVSQVEAQGRPVTVTLLQPRTLAVKVLDGDKAVTAAVRIEGDHVSKELLAQDGQLQIVKMVPGPYLLSAVQGERASAVKQTTLASSRTDVTLQLVESGRLTVALVSEDEEPIPAATLSLSDKERGDVLATNNMVAGSSAQFGPLATGDYVLSIAAAGFESLVSPVVVKPKNNSIELTLTRGSTIKGRVVDEYGRVAPKVSVLVLPMGESFFADENGAFVITVPSPGQYSLQAHHSDWGGGEITVKAPADKVELQLERKASCEVTVTLDGRRVEGAQALLSYAEGSFRSDRPSGADGVVMMRGLPPGEYTLQANHPDALASEKKVVQLEDGKTLAIEARLQSGGELNGVVVDENGAPVSQVQLRLVGAQMKAETSDAVGHFQFRPLKPGQKMMIRLLDRAFTQKGAAEGVVGGELAKVVVARQKLFKGRVMSQGRPVKEFRVEGNEVTSADGRFEVPMTPIDSRLFVSIEAPGFEPLMEERDVNEELGDFELKPAPLISGVVKDETGAAVSDAVVTCDVCEKPVLTAGDGRFSFGRPGFARALTLMAKKGRRTATKPLSVEGSQGVELVLQNALELTGHAFDSKGGPAAGIEIAGFNLERNEPVTTVTSADGSYRMDLAPGHYRFVAVFREFRAGPTEPPATTLKVSRAGQTLDFGRAPQSLELAVEVRPESGFALFAVRGDLPSGPIAPAQLMKMDYAQMVFEPKQSRVQLSGLLPGRYTLVWGNFFDDGSGRVVRRSVDLPQATPVNLTQ